MTNGGLVAFLAVAIAGSAGAQSSAEYQTLGAIARARAVDGQLNSIIALDPTAIAQARAIDQRGAQGPLAGKPVLVKDNIEVAGTAADDRREPGADRQRHRARRAAGGAAARRRGGDPGQGQFERMGQHPIVGFDQRVERGRRADAQSVRARPQHLRQLVGVGRGGGGGDRRLCHRHRDRRVDHLPRRGQRDRGDEADRRAGQPDSCRPDQRKPGYCGADDAHGTAGGRIAERHRGERPRRQSDARGRPAQDRLCRRARRQCAAAARGSG